MKTSILIFFTGLALGITGTLITKRIYPSAGCQAPDTQTDSSPARTRANRSDQDSAWKQRAARMRKARKRNGTSPSKGARDDLARFLSVGKILGDETQINVMDIIRNASLMTMLREDEAIDLLDAISKPTEEIDPELNSELREIASIMIFCRLCELNGPEAMRMAMAKIEANNGKLFDDELFGLGMSSWAAADPDGARRWFEGLLGEADKRASSGEDLGEVEGMTALLEKDNLRAAYFNSMAKHDPEGLKQRIAGIENEELRKAAQDDLMTSLVIAEESTEDLQTLLDKTSESSDARRKAVIKLSSRDPIRAAIWVQSQPSSDTRDREISQVASAMMKKHGDDGVQWYLKQELHDPNKNSQRLSSIVNHLANDNLIKADEWLAQQPDDTTRDSAEAFIARRFSRSKQWSKSMTWIAEIQNEDSREMCLKQTLSRGWNYSDRALRPEVLEAAEAAGHGEAARAFRPR